MKGSLERHLQGVLGLENIRVGFVFLLGKWGIAIVLGYASRMKCRISPFGI
jgi:hypothetical protein